MLSILQEEIITFTAESIFGRFRRQYRNLLQSMESWFNIITWCIEYLYNGFHTAVVLSSIGDNCGISTNNCLGMN